MEKIIIKIIEAIYEYGLFAILLLCTFTCLIMGTGIITLLRAIGFGIICFMIFVLLVNIFLVDNEEELSEEES